MVQLETSPLILCQSLCPRRYLSKTNFQSINQGLSLLPAAHGFLNFPLYYLVTIYFDYSICRNVRIMLKMLLPKMSFISSYLQLHNTPHSWNIIFNLPCTIKLLQSKTRDMIYYFLIFAEQSLAFNAFKELQP